MSNNYIRQSSALVRYFRTHIDPAASLGLVATFLAIAEKDNQTVTEVAERVNAPLSTASRHLLDLADRNRQGGPGLGLVIGQNDPMNLRHRHYRLTPKGKVVASGIIHVLEG
jgi:DNA-binding MarR family transcriptional regulator